MSIAVLDVNSSDTLRPTSRQQSRQNIHRNVEKLVQGVVVLVLRIVRFRWAGEVESVDTWCHLFSN